MCERSREREKEWEEVQHKKRHPKAKNFNKNDGSKGISIVKFYVSNIPEGCRPWDLSVSFRGFGEIAGVYVARKRNKDGMKFGFVSFKGVKNWRDLEDSLQNIKMGSNKLSVNVARHAAENEEVGTGRRMPKENHMFSKPHQMHNNGFFKSDRNGKSFADVVKGKEEVKVQEVEITIDDEVNMMVDAHNRALVAKCVDLDTLLSLGSLLGDFSGDGLEVQYLGGLNMLLIFNNEEGAQTLFQAKDLWKMWFSMLEIWSGQSLPFERIAWVSIYGVPIHLASAEIFNNIGGRFGKVLKPSRIKDDNKNKAVESLGILVGEGEELKKAVTIRWRDKRYRVWVVEKPVNWSPSCTVVPNVKAQPEGDEDQVNGEEMADSMDAQAKEVDEFGVLKRQETQQTPIETRIPVSSHACMGVG